MKNKSLLIIALIIFCNQSFSQNKIKPDINIMNFLGRTPQKVGSNTLPDNLIKILYYKIQPDSFPKIGYMDKEGEILIQPKYNMGLDFYDNYANIIKDSIYGYISKDGTETLFKQYDETFFYYGNTGIAKKNRKQGLIDRKGNPITKFDNKMIEIFGFNRFKLYDKDRKIKILDEKGNVIFHNKLTVNIKSHYFESDSSLVYEEIIENKKLKGLINLDEKILLKPTYENIHFIDDASFFAVKKDNKWGFIDKLGNEIIPLIYDKVGFSINDDLIPVMKSKKWGFINRKNEIIIPFVYDEAHAFMDGLAFVKKEKNYGCIDKKNNTKIPFNLEKTGFPFFTNKMALFKKDNKYGFINKNGKVKIHAIYDKAYPFINGIAYVEINGKAGYINKKGKEIIPIKYKQLWFESEGIIRFTE